MKHLSTPSLRVTDLWKSFLLSLSDLIINLEVVGLHIYFKYRVSGNFVEHVYLIRKKKPL